MPISRTRADLESSQQRPATGLTTRLRTLAEGRIEGRFRAWTHDHLGDRTLAGLVFLLALLIRLPYLQQIPRFNDEVTLWRFAMELGQPGAALPLVFEDTGYNGALLIYLLAALHKLSQAVWAPRP